MKARTWFFALGQSHEARRMPYALCVGSLKLNALPHWVKQAYSAGRLSVMHGGFSKRISSQIEFVRNLPADVVRADSEGMDAMRRERMLRAMQGAAGTVDELQRRIRHYDPEGTARLGAEVNAVDVFTTLDPRAVLGMVPLGVKVNHRYAIAESMVRGEVSFDYDMYEKQGHATRVPGDKSATTSGHAHGVAGKSEGVS